MSYRLVKESKKLQPSNELLFSTLYAKFSMEIVSKLFAQISLQGLDVFLGQHRKELPAEISRKVAIRAQKDITYSYLASEFVAWSLLQPKKKDNIVPLSHENENVLLMLVEQSLTQLLIIYGLSSSEATIKKEAKRILNDVDLSALLRSLQKDFLPPLSDKHPKDYEVLGRKGDYQKEIQDHVYSFQLVKKDSLERAFPTSTIMYYMPSLGNSIFLQMEQVIPYSTFKRIPSTSHKHLSSILFQLLQFYSHGEIFLSSYTKKIDIVEPKLKALHDKSTECFATPFNAEDRPYFSLYPELEHHLGSLGSYLDLQPQSGIFSLRPLNSYIFTQDALSRATSWLKEAEKAGRKLTVLFWFPNMIPPTEEIVFHEGEKNVTKEMTVLRYTEEDLLPSLEISPYLKDVFAYAPGVKLPKNTANYTYKVFVLSSA